MWRKTYQHVQPSRPETQMFVRFDLRVAILDILQILGLIPDCF